MVWGGYGNHCNDSDIDYLLRNSVWDLRLFRQIFRRHITPLTVLIVGGVGVLVLYFVNPADVSWFPRCPFHLLTGLKCPGCGTLRGLHQLMHLHFREAWNLNPLMILSIPLIGVCLVSPKVSKNVFVGRSASSLIILYWVLRNM